jgi:hypothetical protein
MDEQSHVVSEYPRESANKFTASWGPLAGPLFLGRVVVVKMATTGTLTVRYDNKRCCRPRPTAMLQP